MMNTEELKHFSDPLLGGVGELRNHRNKNRSQRTEISAADTRLKPVYLVFFLLTLGAVGLVLYEGRQQIDFLSDELTVNRSQLDQMSARLEESQAEIHELNKGLETSQNQLASPP